MLSPSRLLRKKQPVNYKPTPLNRSLTPNDVSGNATGVEDEACVSPNHRDQVVTEDGRIFFPCPYCSRAFSELANRAVHLDTCPAKSYILSVASAVNPEQTPSDTSAKGDSPQTAARLLEKTHSFTEEEQRAFMQAVQLAKVNEIISENNYNMVLNRLGQRKRISQKVKSLMHSPSTIKSFRNTATNKAAVKSKSAPKNTTTKDVPQKPVAANKSTPKGVSVLQKSAKKSRSVLTQQKLKHTPKKSVMKKVRFDTKTPARFPSTPRKSKPTSEKNVKKNKTAQRSTPKSQGVKGSASPKRIPAAKKVSVKVKPTNPKTKSAPKKTTVKKKSPVPVKTSGKKVLSKSVPKSPNKKTKVNTSKVSKKTKVTVKHNKVAKKITKVIAKKTKTASSKNQKPRKIPQKDKTVSIRKKKETVSKQIIIAPSTDMNSLEMKLADLVNLISDGNNLGSPRLSLKKDEKTGSLVITSETDVGKPRTSTKRPAEGSPVSAKRKKTTDKAEQGNRKSKKIQNINDSSNVNVATIKIDGDLPKEKKNLRRKSGDKSGNSHVEDTKLPLAEFVSKGPRAIKTEIVQSTFKEDPDSQSEIKENKIPENQKNVSNKSKKQTEKKPMENKSKNNANLDKDSKKKTSLPKIVLKTVSGKKNSQNAANKNKRGPTKNVNTSKAKVNPQITDNKTKGKMTTKPVSKRIMERNLKQTINKITIPNVNDPVELALQVPSIDGLKEEQGDILLPVKEETAKRNNTKTAKTEGKITKPTSKRVSARNLKQTINKMKISDDLVLLSASEERKQEGGDFAFSIIIPQEVQTKGKPVTMPTTKRIMTRNLKEPVSKMTLPNVNEADNKNILPLSKANISKQDEQSEPLLLVMKTQVIQSQSPHKSLLQNRKTVPSKKTKPSETASVTSAYNTIDLDVEEVPVSANIRTTRRKEIRNSQTQTSPKQTVTNQVTTEQKTSQIIKIDDDIIELEDDVIELDVEVPEHLIKEARTSKKPLTDEELLSLLALDNNTEVEYIVQNPVPKGKSILPPKNSMVQTKSQESVRNSISIFPTSAKPNASAKPTDNVKPSTSRIDQSSLIQDLILNNIPRDDMHPRKLESYIKQFASDFAAAVNTKELSERASPSDVEIIEDDANSDVIFTKNSPDSKEIVVLSNRVLRTEEEYEGEEMDPLRLEDEEEEDEMKSSIPARTVATMGPATCTYCEEVFENPLELLRHKRQAHKFSKILLPENKVLEYMNTEDYSKCPICQKPLKLHPTMRSKNKWSYVKHLHTHNKDMLFACPKCDKKFKRQDHMKVHERRHY